MNGIQQLGERVGEAERRFGLIYEQQTRYSERLLGLINAIEVRLRDQQAEIDRQSLEIERLGAEAERHADEAARLSEEIERRVVEAARQGEENEQLRTMLLSLLRAIEGGSRNVLAETMQTLDAKVAALIAHTGSPAEGPAPDIAADGVAEAPGEAADAMLEAEPATGEPDMTEPGMIEAEAAEPDMTEAETAEVEMAEPETAEAEMAEAEMAEAETPGPDGQGGAVTHADLAELAKLDTATLTDIMERVTRLVEETGGEMGHPEEGPAGFEAETGPEPVQVPAAAAERRSTAGA